MHEIWRVIVGWEGLYEVSDQGRIRRIGIGRGASPGKILHPHLQNAGYHAICLYRNNVAHNRLIHRLMAEAFIGPIPEAHEINHLDGVKTHNVLPNLAIVTRRENMLHASAAGLAYRGSLNGQAKLTKEDVLAIRNAYIQGGYRAGGLGYKSLGHQYGVSWELIRAIIKRRIWKHLPME